MAEREAAIRLRLRSGSYMSGLRQVQAQTKAVAGKMRAAFAAPVSAGIAGAKRQLTQLGGQLKSTLGNIAKIGGGFAAGAALKSAVDLQSRYRDLAFSVQTMTGEMTDWQSIMAKIQPIAMATSRSSNELADAYDNVLSATKDPAFAGGTLEAIGKFATATGSEVNHVATLVQNFQRKLGATAKEIPDLLAQTWEQSRQGGPTIEDLANRFDELASVGVEAGFEGKEAFRIMLGAMNATDAKMGGVSKQVTGLQNAFLNLRQAQRQASIAKDLKIPKKELSEAKNSFEVMRRILAEGEAGQGALKKYFVGPEERKAISILKEPYDKAFADAKKAGASTKEATQAGLQAFDKSIAEMGRSSMKAGDIQKQFTKRQEDPQRKLASAMELFRQEFTKPDVLKAMEELAKTLPKLAKVLAKVVSFSVENPLLAGGMLVGGRAGMGFAGGFAPQAAKASGKLSVELAKGAGKSLAADFSTQVAKSGKWGAIGKSMGAAAGIAVAAMVAYELGKAAIDNAEKERQAEVGSLRQADIQAGVAMAGKDTKKKRAALATLKAQIAAEEGRKDKYSLGAMQKEHGGALGALRYFAGGGMWQDTYQKGKNLLGGQTDSQGMSALDRAKKQAAALEKALEQGSKGGDKLGKSATSTAAALDRLQRKADAINVPGAGGGPGENGRPAAPRNQPGIVGG